MKKIYSLLAILLISIGAMATQYCATPITSGDKTVLLTCQNPMENTYIIFVQGEGINGAGGSFCYINGEEQLQLNTEGHFTVGENSVAFIIESTTAPRLYTPLFIMMPGEVAFQFPEDVEWITDCEATIVPGDEEESNVLYIWDGSGAAKDSAAVEDGGVISVYLESGNNIVVGNSQKGNWAIKLNKGFKASASEQFSVLIALDEPLAKGDKLTIGAFKTKTTDAVLAIEFNADLEALNQDVVMTIDSLQVIESNAIPEDQEFAIPDEAEGMKFIRLYRKSGSTGIYVTKFMITRGDDGEEPIEPQPEPEYPATAAPDLENEYERVAPIYSDRYGNAIGAEFFPDWQQTTQIESRNYEGDNYIYYTNFNYQGWQFDPIMVSNMKYLHLAIWTPKTGSVNFTPIYGGPNLQTDDKHPYTLNLEGGTWNEFNLDLEETFPGLDFSSIIQMKFDAGVNVEIFAVDNVYFYNPEEAVEDTEKPQDLKIEVAGLGYFDATLKVSATDNSGLVYYSAAIMPTSENQEPTILGFAVGRSGEEVQLKLTKLGTNTEYTDVLVVAQDEAENYIFDYVPTFRTLAGPTSAPEPLQLAENVISFYSDHYFSPTWFTVGNWGQKTHAEEVQLAEGDFAYMLTNFNFLGWENKGSSEVLDLTGMEYIHLDVWAPDATSTLNVTPIWGSEASTSVGELKAGWNQIDMPLTTWAGIDLTKVLQIKFDNGNGGTLFLDNVYFWKDVKDGMDNIKNATVRVDNGTITINSTVGTPIHIYNVAGQMLYNTTSTGTNQISLHRGQVVIVRIADQAAKVIL